MRHQTKQVLPFAALSLIVLISGISLIIVSKLPQTSSSPPSTGNLTPASAYINIEPVVTKSGSTALVEIYLSPTENPINLNTLQLDFTLKSTSKNLTAAVAKPVIAPDFDGNGWSFPFASVTNTTTDTLALKLAALYVNQEDYLLSTRTLFLSIPINNPGNQNLTFHLEPKNSLAYTNQADLIAYPQAGQDIKL